MPPAFLRRRITLVIGITVLAVFAATALRAQAPSVRSPVGQGESAAAARGVHCPPEFETAFENASGVMRCQRDVVSWVVTSCADKAFGRYVAKAGADSCAPNEIPGVGAPPGSTQLRPAVCAAQGYAMVADRTGLRDRCERVERMFAFPKPVG